ncbi:hypothetical protein NQ317_013770 [Molorchus minor]|uniref:3-hydroxyisobutyryl-CoA hydrolase, mitochondrial n=1 Tax=Molorchus minor TaxID=1323400 RepID=A0ABQ9JU02_9CUCU|nr:hypothetical protein NQ317_013770 [Molorchus minor]
MSLLMVLSFSIARIQLHMCSKGDIMKTGRINFPAEYRRSVKLSSVWCIWRQTKCLLYEFFLELQLYDITFTAVNQRIGKTILQYRHRKCGIQTGPKQNLENTFGQGGCNETGSLDRIVTQDVITDASAPLGVSGPQSKLINRYEQSKLLIGLFKTALTNTRKVSGGHEEVILQNVGDKGLIILNRPDAMNAMNVEMAKKVYNTLKKWKSIKSAVILKGTGNKAYCVGGDLKSIVLAEKTN